MNTGNTARYAGYLVAAIVLVAAGYLARTYFPPWQPPKPPVPPPIIVAKEGQEIEIAPQPPQDSPPVVREQNLVRQTLKPGTTHETLLKGSIETVGTDRQWGIESVVSIYYMFEAQIDREILENDGSVIVEHRHFRSVRSTKLDTSLKDLRIHLGPATVPILATLGLFSPDAAIVGSQLNDVSAKPILKILEAFGIDLLKISGAHDAIKGMFTKLDTLSGKSVEQVYWNKEDRTGIIRLKPLSGGNMTEDERFFHQHSAVLSDVLLFPERTKEVGKGWDVKGAAFSNLIDPGLRAAVGGALRISRRADRNVDGKPLATLVVDGGRLTLDSDEAQNRIGWFEPSGEMLFSTTDEVVVEADLNGRGLLERVSRTHLLFRTEMKQEPQIHITYSCRVIPTVSGSGR